jgi:hypothetical protein
LSCAGASDAISAGRGRGCSDGRIGERLRLAPTAAPTWRRSSGRRVAPASSALVVALPARPVARRIGSPRADLSMRRAGAQHGPRVVVPGRQTLPPTGSCSPRPPALPADVLELRPPRPPPPASFSPRRRAPAGEHGLIRCCVAASSSFLSLLPRANLLPPRSLFPRRAAPSSRRTAFPRFAAQSRGA